NGSQVLKVDLSCRVKGGALDGCHRVHAASDGRSDHIVHVAHVQDVIRLPVVCTETEMVKEPDAFHALPDLLHIIPDSRLPGGYKHTAAKLLQRLIALPGLMAGIGAAAEVS